MLGVAGGAAGIAIAFTAIRYFRAAMPVELPPESRTYGLNWPVLDIHGGCYPLGTAMLFGALPAWRASRMEAIADASGRVAATRRPRRERVMKAVDRGGDGALHWCCCPRVRGC